MGAACSRRHRRAPEHWARFIRKLWHIRKLQRYFHNVGEFLHRRVTRRLLSRLSRTLPLR